MDKQLLEFPKGFLFGTATSSYQIEGAWNEDGKGENIWDRYCHDKMDKVRGNENADVAIDHYHRYEEDLDLLQKIGCKVYRFSISWARILPDGVGEINQKGIDFYNNIINGLIARGIEPAITLFHWDYPEKLQEKGGWANRESIDWFLEYAKVCFKAFGDRVKLWMTFNEMQVFTLLGYGSGVIPPCIRDYKMAVLTVHNSLVAHGKTVRLYRSLNQGGKIGVALDIVPKVPETQSKEDIYAADVANSTTQFLFYDAIVKGKYPETAIKVFNENGYMPDIDLSELSVISEKPDFIGINYYLTQICRYKKGEGRFDYEIVETENSSYVLEGTGDIRSKGLYDLLIKIKNDTDGKLPVMITENGYGHNAENLSFEEELHDEERIDYVKRHLLATKRAIDDGVDVTGYMLWSAFDNFEWRWGYCMRFGLIYVDYKTQKRTLKDSALWYKELIEKQKADK